MALVAVVTVVVGAVTSVALQSYLERQVDERLSQGVQRDHGRGLDFVAAPGNPLGAVGLRNGGGVVSADPPDADAPDADAAAEKRVRAHLDKLTPAQVKALDSVPRDGEPHRVTVPGLGEYRVLAGSGDGNVLPGQLPPGIYPGPGPGAGPDAGRDAGDAGLDAGPGVAPGTGTPSSGQPLVLGFPLNGVQETIHTLVVVVVCVTLAALVAAGLAGHALVGAALRPLRRIAATATRVSELPLDRGEVALHERVPQAQADARTEVGQVGAALNRMLGHVGSALAARQDSEMRVRRFVADASHELRTPLASIRGYAELTRRSDEAAATGPDTRHALGRIESEATRMTGLVEDLLLLARLDADADAEEAANGPGRPVGRGRPNVPGGPNGTGRPDGPAQPPRALLAQENTDLLPLVVDAVSDARVAGQDHVWQLELPGEPVLVRGDPARLQQVLVNLLGNARTHTPPGTTVTTCVRAEPADGAGRGVVVEVRDDGPGIAPELVGRVFERFARGDVARTRTGPAGQSRRPGRSRPDGTTASTARPAPATAPPASTARPAPATAPPASTARPAPVTAPPASTGLGLAIVRAVVLAHGGTVGVESVPGRTVFTVRLPEGGEPHS
ncbi:sensor histidine kinase [Streptomyces sp. NPDC058657]|uniref:sensor histidine kinase n=1 Tax=unclassified Streptomyces TaxID=2593676 RepID=UPI0036652DF7